MKKLVRVRVPASSANLGPGYDVLGIALDLYNEVELSAEKVNKGRRSARTDGSSPLKIEVSGEGEGVDSLPMDERNIVWQSAKSVFQRSRFPFSLFRFHLKCVNRIPLARGLGSSSAARLGGILAANSLCDNFLSKDEVLDLAAEMEGHPDNVVSSLLGGLCIASTLNGRVRFIRLEPPKELCAVVCLPDFKLSTEKARSVLPKNVSHSDAVHNVSRVALLLGALAKRDYSCLKVAMEDRLHQDYRKKLIPGFDLVMKNGYRAGALGVSLSGAGPSIFAFAPRSKSVFIGEQMKRGFLKAGQNAESFILKFNLKGSEVVG